ncbi:MAG: FecR domain-containing protein [Desulfobacterales bacterium]|nr:FecR domain-containing protein [Desulfobacterales bacterium]
MKLYNKFLLKIFIIFTMVTVNASPVVINSKNAVVTIVEGKVALTIKGSTDSIDVKKGDFISEGDKIKTGISSRVEIKLADNSIVRFDEKTSFVLETSKVNTVNKKRKISIKLILGKTWANVTKLFGKKKGGFAISSKTVVAGVRGTVYRMNVEEDYSSVIKVYTGEVAVGKHAKKKKTNSLAPHPVKGPHAVSMKEWVYIVKSMQQVIVGADGTIKKPVGFTEKEDSSRWVEWNKKLDNTVKR